MAFWRGVKRRARAAVAPVIFLGIVAYFGWNALHGDRGLEEYGRQQKDLIAAQADLTAAQTEQADWEKRVVSLSTNQLDLDSLDERARAMLNLADPNDIVVPYGAGKKLF